MIPIIVSTFIASLMGSGHCAAMCGPFAMIASAVRTDRRLKAKERFWLVVSYHLGRLTTYVIFGIFAGLLGLFVNFSGDLIGMQYAAIVFAGGLLILFGLTGLLRNLGVRIEHIQTNQLLNKFLHKRIQAVSSYSPGLRAFSIGLFTTLMPCGWLYFFVIAASTTQSLILAPMVMVFFWLGTVPVLVSLGLFAHGLIDQLKLKAQWIIPVTMVIVGVSTIYFRTPISGGDFSQDRTDKTAEIISEALQAQLPCCCDDNS